MRGSLLALALLACALVMGVSTASAATTTVKVTPNNQPVLWPSTDTRPGGSFDALNGGNGVWWSTRDIPDVCASNCFVKWSDIVAANPTATIQGELINQGSGNPGIDANLDAYTFGANGNATTWNFDPLTGPPTS